MWLPDILFAAFALYILWRADQEKPLISEKFTDTMAVISENYLAPLARRIFGPIRRLISRRKPAPSRPGPGRSSTMLLIHANAHTRDFHLPGCEHYNCPDCTIEFNSVQVAQEAGFVPCPFCKTLINSNDR